MFIKTFGRVFFLEWRNGEKRNGLDYTRYLITMNYKPEKLTFIFSVRKYYSQFETINLGHQQVPRNDLDKHYVSKRASVHENQIVVQIGAKYFGF